ncbi:hypothetical protein LTS17_006246 [Exophiala oligosperma]
MSELALTASSLGRSRIPHLALSLLSKRAVLKSRQKVSEIPTLSGSYYTRSTSTATTYGYRNGYTTRRYASSTTLPRAPPPPPPPRTATDNTRPTRSHNVNNNNNNNIPPSPPPPPPSSRTRLASRRTGRSFNVYFYPVCGVGFVLSTYLMYMYTSYRRAVAESEMLDLAQNADVSSRWMDLSRNFDDEVDFSERFMLLGRRRRNLCRQAVGNVLEVSAGTGRNLEYYNLDPIRTPRTRRVKSLVFNDLSEIMVYQARKKFDSMQEHTENIAKFRGDVRFVVGDAAERRLIARPEGGFDTIVQTMGVCSMANPVAFLKRLGELVRQPGERSTGVDVKAMMEEEEERQEGQWQKRDYGADQGTEREKEKEPAETLSDRGGKILLLEHGRSYYGFVNRFLDNNAKLHAHRYGCWNNKDIDQVIRDSGLIVESKRRYHLGTTYEYVLRPNPRQKSTDKEVASAMMNATTPRVDAEGVMGKSKSAWWKIW